METFTVSQTELEQVFFLWGQMTASGGTMPADKLAKHTLEEQARLRAETACKFIRKVKQDANGH
jgi:hypothetical protein